MSRYVKVDASWLPATWATNSHLTVEFYDDGQLKKLARHRDGVCVADLTLEHGRPRGRQTDHSGSGGSADWTTHEDGFSENFDAWSDNSKPFADPFATFVRRSIERVVRSQVRIIGEIATRILTWPTCNRRLAITDPQAQSGASVRPRLRRARAAAQLRRSRRRRHAGRWLSSRAPSRSAARSRATAPRRDRWFLPSRRFAS